MDVSNTETLASHLTKSGFDGSDLIKKASQQHIKDQLRRNTEEAAKLGLCGVPTYIVHEKKGNDWVPAGGIVWGQDELAVVEDLIAGWREEEAAGIADVSTAHGSGDGKATSRL